MIKKKTKKFRRLNLGPLSISDKISRKFVHTDWVTVMPVALIKWNIWNGVQHIKKTEHKVIINIASRYN